MSLDACPTCGRRVRDFDVDALEAHDGQRWCVKHAPVAALLDAQPAEVVAAAVFTRVVWDAWLYGLVVIDPDAWHVERADDVIDRARERGIRVPSPDEVL